MNEDGLILWANFLIDLCFLFFKYIMIIHILKHIFHLPFKTIYVVILQWRAESLVEEGVNEEKGKMY